LSKLKKKEKKREGKKIEGENNGQVAEINKKKG